MLRHRDSVIPAGPCIMKRGAPRAENGWFRVFRSTRDMVQITAVSRHFKFLSSQLHYSHLIYRAVNPLGPSEFLV